jgi:prepilin-type N-terminal cleavage/methylation domain-containing protein
VSARIRATRGPRDAGLTLIELLVTMVLMGVVGTLIVTAVAQSVRILTHTKDEGTGLSDAKVVMDRVARDIRQARSVECSPPAGEEDYCKKNLTLWIDANSNYVRDAGETVTWRLEQNADGEHFDVWRIVGDPTNPASPRQVQASSLIVEVLFDYGVDGGGTAITPADADIVRFTMEYDAILDRGTERREAAFSARLRNKG